MPTPSWCRLKTAETSQGISGRKGSRAHKGLDSGAKEGQVIQGLGQASPFPHCPALFVPCLLSLPSRALLNVFETLLHLSFFPVSAMNGAKTQTRLWLTGFLTSRGNPKQIAQIRSQFQIPGRETLISPARVRFLPLALSTRVRAVGSYCTNMAAKGHPSGCRSILRPRGMA